VRAADGRPLFVCNKCKAEWTSGDGSEYLGYEMNIKAPLPKWVLAYDCEPVEVDEVEMEKFWRMISSIKPRPNRKLSTKEKRRKKRGLPDPWVESCLSKKLRDAAHG
jgi:hypothetical protein